MNAAERLAKWCEAERAATEGPWAPWLDQDGAKHMQGRLMVGNADAVIPDGETWIEGVDVNPVAECYTPEDRTFIATARTAMPALLAFAEAVLALCDKADINPVDGLRKVHTASIRQALEQHLGDEIDHLAEEHLGGAS